MDGRHFRALERLYGKNVPYSHSNPYVDFWFKRYHRSFRAWPSIEAKFEQLQLDIQLEFEDALKKVDLKLWWRKRRERLNSYMHPSTWI